jgi:hypothetical protein
MRTEQMLREYAQPKISIIANAVSLCPTLLKHQVYLKIIFLSTAANMCLVNLTLSAKMDYFAIREGIV